MNETPRGPAPNADASDLEIWIPPPPRTVKADSSIGWVPVAIEDQSFADAREMIDRVRSIVSDVGLGDRLRMDGYPDHGRGPLWESLPRYPLPSQPFIVMVLPGSVVIAGEREIDQRGRSMWAARLTLSRPCVLVEVWHALEIHREVRFVGGVDIPLARIAIENAVMGDGPVNLGDGMRPVQVIQVGRSLGIVYRWAGPRREPAFAVWVPCAGAYRIESEPTPRTASSTMALEALRLIGVYDDRAPNLALVSGEGDIPADLAGFLDRGEHVARRWVINYKDRT